jgi:hypothetical protein
MEGVELENEEDVTNGERDEKSIVAARESGCCVTPSFCVNAERTDGERASDAVVVVDNLAASDTCVCGPPGVGVPLSVYVV